MFNSRVGFRFNPTEEELVRYYLANRVAGASENLWEGLINDFDAYSEEPWDLWRRFYRPNLMNYSETKSDECIYFFTTLKKLALGGNGKRVNRRVENSCGTWKEQSSKMCNEEAGVWYRRRFSYKNPGEKDHDGQWLMMELCLHDDDTMVLCRIAKKPSSGHDCVNVNH